MTTLAPIDIMKTVAAWHGIKWHIFISSAQYKEVTSARREAWWIARGLGYSSTQIAKPIGFNHSSIIVSSNIFAAMVADGTAPDNRAHILNGTTPPPPEWVPKVDPVSVAMRGYKNRRKDWSAAHV